MDLAANEKAVHADFFNGKDTGIGLPVSACVSSAGYGVEWLREMSDVGSWPGPLSFLDCGAAVGNGQPWFSGGRGAPVPRAKCGV